MNNAAPVFKANDIRGRYPEDLDEDLFQSIGRAAGSLLGAGSGAIVGGDVRPSTPALMAALSDGLQQSGVNVLQTGIRPTPVHYFAARQHPDHAGVFIVTASHNPPGDNGLKFMLHGAPTTPEQMERLRQRCTATPPAAARPGARREWNPFPAYERWILSRFGAEPHRRLTVAVDAGNGCWSTGAPRLFDRCGFRVLPLFCFADGTFPHRRPDSAVTANLAALRRLVSESRADLGVAFDGDGDRAAFVDETGQILTADETAAILSRIVLPPNGGTLVYDLKMSRIIRDLAHERGAQAYPERSGHAFIKARMLSEVADFGCEASGHYFYRDLTGGDDALFTALLLAVDLATAGDSLADRRNALPPHCITPDLRVACPPDQAEPVLRALAEAFPADRVTTLDGVRVDFEDGWGLARASITEPKMTFRFEAASPCALDRIAGAFVDAAGELGPVLRQELERLGPAREERSRIPEPADPGQ